MIGSMVFMIGAICIPFFSTGLEMFLVGGIIQGLPWGVFQTLAISYAADLCPTHLRGTHGAFRHRKFMLTKQQDT
jgi:SP family general alpha glucoside:H+ symporter-like MFS transporter